MCSDFPHITYGEATKSLRARHSSGKFHIFHGVAIPRRHICRENLFFHTPISFSSHFHYFVQFIDKTLHKLDERTEHTMLQLWYSKKSRWKEKLCRWKEMKVFRTPFFPLNSIFISLSIYQLLLLVSFLLFSHPKFNIFPAMSYAVNIIREITCFISIQFEME
jgi:hypothetical protein